MEPNHVSWSSNIMLIERRSAAMCKCKLRRLTTNICKHCLKNICDICGINKQYICHGCNFIQKRFKDT